MNTATQPPIRKQEIAQRFSRAAASYADHAALQAAIADTLLQQASAYGVVLDVGCGRGRETQRLLAQASVETVFALDMSAAMLSGIAPHPRLQCLQADMENVPLPSASMDTILSNFALQWCSSPQTVMQEMARLLKPGGQLLVSVPGPGSLSNLKASGLLHVNTLASSDDWVAALQQAGLTLCRVESQPFTAWFPTARDLLHAIKGIGAGASDRPRQNHLQGRAWLTAVQAALESSRQAEGLPLSYHVIFLWAKKADQSQS